MKKTTQKIKIALLLNLMGEEGLEGFHTLKLTGKAVNFIRDNKKRECRLIST